MRTLFFITISLLSFIMPWWFFGLIALWYAARYDGYELIILGVMHDAVFGVPGTWTALHYTLTLGVLVFVTTLLKPHVSYYNERI